MDKELSKKEQQIVELILDYKTYKEIACILHISPRTVEWHVKNIMAKTKCRKKGDIIRKFHKAEQINKLNRIVEYDINSRIFNVIRRYITSIINKLR